MISILFWKVKESLRLFETEPITFKRDEIEIYPVLFFHRLMKKLYGKPPQIEIEIDAENSDKSHYETVFLTRTETKGKWKIPLSSNNEHGNIAELIDKDLRKPPKEWRYFLSTESGAIILVGTKDRCETMLICHVFFQNKGKQDITQELIADGKTFVSRLLKEAKRLKNDIPSPRSDFKKNKGVGLYLLHNVYLYNYGSAERMLELSEKNENDMRVEFTRYDTSSSSSKLSDSEESHIAKYMVACGMYYQPCISFYFMALEGFVNLIYHSFLRENYRNLDLEKGLDLEKKIRFMLPLCNGFKSEHIDLESEILKKFKSLKNYRNQIFHSKIEDVLKSVCIIEDGFYYNYDMKEQNPELFPANKINLRKDHVLSAKKIVDEIVSLILSKMDSDSKSLVRRFILKEVQLPFWKEKNGKVHFGNLPKKLTSVTPKTS